MARTDANAVKELMRATAGGESDYDSANAPSLQPFIDSANAFTDRVAVCAVRKDVPLTNAELELIERWMAAHFYTKTDRTLSSKSTSKASGSYVNDPQVPEPYKAGAMALDPSGCVAALLNRQRAGAFWAGKPRSEQLAWEDRN